MLDRSTRRFDHPSSFSHDVDIETSFLEIPLCKMFPRNKYTRVINEICLFNDMMSFYVSNFPFPQFPKAPLCSYGILRGIIKKKKEKEREKFSFIPINSFLLEFKFSKFTRYIHNLL